MATEGTRDGSSSMNRGQGKYFDREKRPGGGTRFKPSSDRQASRGDRQGNGERPPRASRPYGDKTGTDMPYGDRNRGERSERSYGERSERSYGDKPYGERPSRNERPNRNYGASPKFPKKDEDEEDRGRRSKPSRPKENKPTVSIPDKNKVQMRLEKEQKSVKKKQNNKKRESNRPQPRQKRSSNINYTKNYANGAYDDYDDFDDFDDWN